MNHDDWRWHVAAAVVYSALGLAVSYFFAMAGEPSAVWWWRDVFGVMP